MKRIVQAADNSLPVQPEDRALVTLEFFNGRDRNMLACITVPVYFPRRMQQVANPKDPMAILHLLQPAIQKFVANAQFCKPTGEILGGVGCLSCGDRKMYWLSSAAVVAKGLFRTNYRYSCETTSVPVCDSNRKNCLRQGRKVNAELTVSSGLVCMKCGKLDSESARGVKMKACASCKTMTYCSRDCQRTDWARHKLECRGELKK